MTELYKAHRQWAERPKDQRFPSLEALYEATKRYADNAAEKTVAWSDLHTVAIGDEVQLRGRGRSPAGLTHWAFGQLAVKVGAPANYLRAMPAELAVRNLNWGLREYAESVSESKRSEQEAQILFQANGSLLARAITTDRYSRIWDWEVAQRLLDLQEKGWIPAVPDIRAFKGAEPALYASDHDLFAFVRHQDRYIEEEVNGTHTPLWRGVIVENSEVGASALKLTRFFYREMCGNHIIWGASKVLELRVRHVGDARNKMRYWAYEMRKYADEGMEAERTLIMEAQRKVIAQTKEEVLDIIFGKRSINLPKKVLEASYEAVNEDQDGDPRTVWGMVQGITRHSQSLPYADERTKLDRAAGRLLVERF